MGERVMSWAKEKAVNHIRQVGLVPIVRTGSTKDAILAVEAIIASGIGIAEITMTVPNALKVIEEISGKIGDQVLIGSGTILDRESCESAIAAGADFIITPSFDSLVIETAQKHGKPCIAGALTPTEILAAWRCGADFVKVFPCGPVGGPKYIRALKGPFPQIELVPTGGVTLESVGDFIRAGAAAVAVGGELVDLKMLREGNVQAITSLAGKFKDAIKLARLPVGKN